MQRCRKIVLGLALLSSLVPARADAFELELELALRNRFMLERSTVERLLRYDASAAAFDTRSYLNPVNHDLGYAFLASAGIYLGFAKWIGFGLSVDSGLFNPRGKLPRRGSLELVRLQSLFGPSVPVITTADRRTVTSNGQELGDEAKEGYFVRQAFFRLAAPETNWFVAEIGRRSMDVAGGLIYNDFGLGASITADLELLKDWPVRLSVQALLPTRSYTKGMRSPLVELRASYLLSIMEQVGLLFAYYHDGDDNFGQLFGPTIAEVAVAAEGRLATQLHSELFGLVSSTGTPSKADLFWVGAEGTKLLGDFMLSATFLVQFGEVRLDNPFAELTRLAQSGGITLPSTIPREPRIELPTLGFAVDLSGRYLISESMAVGGFFLLLSGERNPFLTADQGSLDTYHSFLSVMPYLTHTNLFFSGGMNETFSGRQATTAGLNGRGVIAPGATFEWEITDEIKVGATTAALFSWAKSLEGGTFYGVEIDVEGSWSILSWLSVSLEYDLLVPGSFFARRTPIHKLMLGLDLSYEYSLEK